MSYEVDLTITHPLLAHPLRIVGTVTPAAATPLPEPAPTPAPATVDPAPPAPAPEPAAIDPIRYGKLTLPIDADSNGSADEIPAAQLGSYSSEFFHIEDGAAVFTAPVDAGGRTPNAKYVRSELREQIVLGSDRANWPFAGTHVQSGEFVVDELPAPIGNAAVKTVVAQIHGVEASPPIKLQVFRSASGTVQIYGIYNLGPNESSVSGRPVLIALGQRIAYRIAWASGVLTLEIDGREIDRFSVPAWAGHTFYFKAGNYVQNLPTTATGRAVVRHLALATSHAPG